MVSDERAKVARSACRYRMQVGEGVVARMNDAQQ